VGRGWDGQDGQDGQGGGYDVRAGGCWRLRWLRFCVVAAVAQHSCCCRCCCSCPSPSPPGLLGHWCLHSCASSSSSCTTEHVVFTVCSGFFFSSSR
jgi:hypothetical protein